MRPTPDVRLQPGAQLPVSAAVVVTDAARGQVDEYGSFGTLGWANTWVCETGEGFVPALEDAMRATFARTSSVTAEQQAAPGDARITVDVERVKVVERDGFWVRVDVHAVARDPSGAVRLDRRYTEEHEGSTAAAFFGGAGAAAPALLIPTETGLARALEKVVVDLRKVFTAAPPVVADLPPGPPPPPPPPEGEAPIPAAGACVPPCRSGYVCSGEGICISACNPPCPAGQTCTEAGQCVVPQQTISVAIVEPPQEVIVRDERPKRSRTANAFVAIHADILGFGQLGPTLTFEMGTRFSGLVRARSLHLGALSYFLIATPTQPLARGFSVGGGARFYSAGKGNLRGFFVGPAAEVISTSVLHPREYNGSGSGLAYEAIHVLPTLELGYRWAFGNFLLGLGGAAGTAIPVYAKRTPTSCTEGCIVLPSNASQRSLLPFVAITLDLGVLF